jgi:transaldolase
MIRSSETAQVARALEPAVHDWVRQGFAPAFGQRQFAADARWQALQKAGSELWLDTGDMDAAGKLWTREFRALTTNNTLLNKEVQRGQYDDLVRRTVMHLRGLEPDIPERMLVLEIAFVLNAYHGLRLVERFDAMVSVEEHTDLADDADLAVLYAKRFYAICPERFIVKLPLTPAGLLAMRRLRRDGVPINFTLGFSARQNWLAALVGDPSFVNVFLGRLNAFVADSKLGTGNGVGEKATLASQEGIRELRGRGRAATRQIAASMRSGEQVWTLAGVDVLTMPTSVAAEYYASPQPPPGGAGPASAAVSAEIDPGALGRLHLDCLWEISDTFRQAVNTLCQQDLDRATGADLVRTLREQGVADLFPDYTPAELENVKKDGKIPKLERWRERLERGTTSLDSLINQAGLLSFTTDQEQLDARVRGLIS